MCRLALLNKSGIDYIEKKYGLKYYFDFLEKRLGGHGNGLAIIDGSGELVKIRKGVNLTNEEIAEEILSSQNIKWIIYHTRLASCGSRTTANCHPFVSRDGKTVLAANGTEHDLTATARIKGLEMTDTEMILRYFLDDESTFYDDLYGWNSTLVGWHHGKVFAVRNRGSLEQLVTGGDEIIIASEIPFRCERKKLIREFFET